MIRYIISKMMGVEGLLMLLPMIVGIIYGEHTSVYFLITAAILTAIYLLFGRKCPENMTIYAKEGLIIVATAWIFWSLAGALPFVLSKSIPSYVDAFFETVSGFTTTGSTILTEIEGLPKGILFWRSLTHWVGGMGVLVFVMVLTSLDEKNSMHLMRAEVPGPEADKLVPKARGTARILYGMYFALTAIEVVFLLAGGMNLFDAVTHAFSTAGTGGFSGYNASVAHFNSAYIDGVITVFMILFGINFNLYFFLLLKEFKSVFKNEELRTYLGIIAGATVVITCNIAGGYHSLLKAFRIKVSRLLILVKSIRRELKTMIHPKAVNIVKVNGKKVKEETMRGVYVYFIAYILILIVSVLLISINNFDFTTSFTGVLTTLNNVGPGLNLVGPVENFAKFSDFSKIVFCVDMLIGRLEIFPFLMLFSPSLWSRKF